METLRLPSIYDKGSGGESVKELTLRWAGMGRSWQRGKEGLPRRGSDQLCLALLQWGQLELGIDVGYSNVYDKLDQSSCHQVERELEGRGFRRGFKTVKVTTIFPSGWKKQCCKRGRMIGVPLDRGENGMEVTRRFLEQVRSSEVTAEEECQGAMRALLTVSIFLFFSKIYFY